jgi:hypothetical protein
VDDPSIRRGDAEDLFGAECLGIEGDGFGRASDIDVRNDRI